MTRLGLTVVPVLMTGITALAAPVASAPAPQPSATPAAGAGWPLLPGPDRVADGFDPPAEPWLAGNRGVDLAGQAGQAVHAATGGIVSFAGSIAGIGVVSVTDGAIRTTYQPLHVAVREGQRVSVGTVLGTLTAAGSHCAPRACLHWGLLRGEDYLDPLALLGLEQVRLLPLPDSAAS
ncbi:MAG TPA: M23 family metallopeptidase [Mycobacteriales bacterium]|nr:M23 family metallopeptidase [Mycobacteriales bacterium]